MKETVIFNQAFGDLLLVDHIDYVLHLELSADSWLLYKVEEV